MQTSGTTIGFTTTTGNVFITEADNAAVSGTSTSGNVTLVSTTGSLTLGLIGTSTATATVNITVANAILDGNAAANNIAALNAVLTSGTGVSTAADGEIEHHDYERRGHRAGPAASSSPANGGALNIGGISAVNGVSATSGNNATITRRWRADHCRAAFRTKPQRHPHRGWHD